MNHKQLNIQKVSQYSTRVRALLHLHNFAVLQFWHKNASSFCLKVTAPLFDSYSYVHKNDTAKKLQCHLNAIVENAVSYHILSKNDIAISSINLLGG